MEKTNDVFKFYEEEFNSDEYVKLNIDGDDYECKWVIEDQYHRLFNEGKLPGKTLIDVGCGPLFRPALSGSAFVNEIHLCDFVNDNVVAIEKWLNKIPNAPDYTNQFKYVAELEGKTDYKYLEDRTRKVIKAVFRCDILADNPLSPRPHQEFDIVTCTGVLDSFPDDQVYLKAMQNLAKLIKPGGHLCFFGTLEASSWGLGGKTFPLPFVTVGKLTEVFNKVNLKVCEINEHECTMNSLDTYDLEGKGCFTALATKPM